MSDMVRLGISTCLLGGNVRYDGGHKLDRFLSDTLGQFVEYVPVCPEVECGLPVPREAMHLEGDPEYPRLVTIRTHEDITPRMIRWGEKRLDELEQESLCGYIFKTNSPSSGMRSIKVYSLSGMPVRNGVGIWARMFMDRFPRLPVEDEGRLHDPGIRENFIERIFVYRRWLALTGSTGMKPGHLVEFHTDHKLLVMAHSVQAYRELGRLVAEGKNLPPRDLYDTYIDRLMKALALMTTVKKNVNVLQHIMGYFKRDLTADEKRELLDIIGRYADGFLPLVVPVTLLNHYVRKYGQEYLRRQHYLNPHPVELKLRNHA